MESDPFPGHSIRTLLFLASDATAWLPYAVVFVLLLLGSSLSSATEVAFFSLTPKELEALRKSSSKSDQRILHLLRHPRSLLAAILVANNIFNVSIVLVATMLLNDIQSVVGWEPWFRFLIEVLVVTSLILFFGEVTPKIFASHHPLTTARRLLFFTHLTSRILHPITWLLTRTTQFLEKPMNTDTEQVSLQDLRQVIDLTSDKESPEEEKDILKGIVNFGNISVRSILKSRVDVKYISIGMPFSEVIAYINECGYSRLPVVEQSLDQVKGILYVKDLLALLPMEGNPEWQSLIRPAYFVPESKKIDDLLDDFKAKRLHIAIVVDEYGGASGIVTLEDVLEEIFGDIKDEYDEEEELWSQLSPTEWRLDGSILLNDLVRITDLPESQFEAVRGDNDSLAGLILEINGTFPVTGQEIKINNLIFIIESVNPKRIHKIRMVILPDTEEDE
ncbi:MAG: gliding motility-associated protein GldE [Sphingobacteriia bacterium]|nr:gliding motility-associated protein GldE [Sphingobacteriia bacterium]